MSAELNDLKITVPLPNWPDPWVIIRPWDKLTDKYFDFESVLSVEFDLYAVRRAADPGWADRVEGADLTATVLMNSRLDSRDVNTVLANRPAVDIALARVPAGLDLADADLTAGGLQTALVELFAAFRGHRVGVAKTMKVICLKRPRLLPMLDEYVRCALYNADGMGDTTADPMAFAVRTADEVGLFRRILTTDDNRRRLGLLATALSAEIERRTGVANAVTPVRVLDNLLWFEWGGRLQFEATHGWREDLATRTVNKPG